MRNLIKFIGLLNSVFVLAVANIASADVMLRASHQFPAGDPRDEMVQIIKREVEAADVGLSIRVYPAASLFKPHDQWLAMIRGRVDMTALPLDYASSYHPQFSSTLMPGIVRNHDHARRLNDSEFIERIKKIINDAGAIVLADAWLAGGFASTSNCILWPDDIKGHVTRGAGPAYERMLAAAGASLASMPSSEIYTAMQTGVLDSTSTSSASMISFRIYEQTKCLTAPGDYALWFMYEPILMSKRSWDKLSEEQQEALMAASKKSEEFFFNAAKEIDERMVETFKKAGVEVVTMNEEQFNAWREIAMQTSYQHFMENVPDGESLIQAALEAE